MGFLDFFRSEALRKKWIYKSAGSIWRILFSGNGLIAGEDRDGDSKTVSYFCLDEDTGKAIWLGRKFGREWWSGIDAIAGDLLFVHSFASPELPEHRGIHAIDLRSGMVRWEQPAFRFLSADAGGVIASDESSGARRMLLLDPVNGNLVEEIEDSSVAERRTTSESDIDRSLFPEFLSPENVEESFTVDRFIHREDLAGNIEFIRRGDLLMFNYHEKNSRSSPRQIALDNKFKIVSMANEHLLFAETLNTDVSYPVPDAFFIHDETLFFVKDRSILTAIQL